MRILLLSVLIFFHFFCFSQVHIDYELNNCTLRDKDKQAIQTIANYELGFLRSVFTYDSFTIKVVLYGNEADFNAIRQQAQVKTLTGFYSPYQKKCFVYKHDDFVYTIQHEIFHAMLHYRVPVLPKWINEGLAEYFERAYARKNGNVVVELQNPYIVFFRKWNEKYQPDIKSFLSLSNYDWNRLYQDLPFSYPYTVSYSMVAYLMQKDEQLVQQLLLEVSKKTTTEDAFNKLYNGGEEAFVKDFLRYIK